jgi:hypothetical protein
MLFAEDVSAMVLAWGCERNAGIFGFAQNDNSYF